MKRELREKARQLRRKGNSITDIAKQLGVSKGSVSTWCRDIKLTKEQKAKLKEKRKKWGAQNKGAQVNRQRALEQRKIYQEEGRARAQQYSPLHLQACMLYWAEGAKMKKNSVHFANSDEYMILLFMKFLRTEFDIPEDKYRLQIHCHTKDTEEHERIIKFWTSLLDLSKDCVQKIQVKKGSQTRKNRLENGICTLQVHDTQITHHIFGAIQEYGGFDNPDWLFA